MKPGPKPRYTARRLLRLTPEMDQDLMAYAVDNGETVADLIRRIIAKHMDEWGP